MGKKTTAQRLDTLSGRIGATVRARREKLGLTVDEMAAKLAHAKYDVAIITLYKWESGANPIPINALPVLAKVLSTTLRKLIPDA